MKCPKCDNEQYCPCKNCIERSKGQKTWIWVDGNTIKCAFCGLTEHADFWETEAWKQHKKLIAEKEESKREASKH